MIFHSCCKQMGQKRRLHTCMYLNFYVKCKMWRLQRGEERFDTSNRCRNMSSLRLSRDRMHKSFSLMLLLKIANSFELSNWLYTSATCRRYFPRSCVRARTIRYLLSRANPMTRPHRKRLCEEFRAREGSKKFHGTSVRGTWKRSKCRRLYLGASVSRVCTRCCGTWYFSR